jgi:hypothetical protein
MSNVGLAGFLLRKTIQPTSLRFELSKDPKEFKTKNAILYIHKNVQDIREKEGD